MGARERPRAQRERVLRATVRRYGSCLARLPALERRVLVLRAALERSQSRPRQRVAALTATTVRSVTRAEHRGLRRLRAMGRRGGCAVLAPATMVFASSAPAHGPLPVLPAIGAPVPGSPAPGSGVKSEHRSGRVTRTPAASSSAAPLIAVPAVKDAGVGNGGINPIVVIVPLLLLTYLGWVVRGELRKS